MKEDENGDLLIHLLIVKIMLRLIVKDGLSLMCFLSVLVCFFSEAVELIARLFFLLSVFELSILQGSQLMIGVFVRFLIVWCATNRIFLCRAETNYA